jgi:beta-fructofuranosidase
MGNYLEDSFHTEPGTDCACPNVLPLGGGKHIILFFSHNQGPKYYTGTSDLQSGRFKTKKHGRMNYGPVGRGSLHTPSGFVDTDGRCIGVWNIAECMISDNFQGTKGQIMSLPRRLSLNPVKTADEGFNIRASILWPLSPSRN